MIRVPGPALPTAGQPGWGTSAKVALKRALTVAQARGDRHIGPTHILLGVLRAGEGTVPRALTAAGVDVTELAGRAAATLDEDRYAGRRS